MSILNKLVKTMIKDTIIKTELCMNMFSEVSQ